VTPRGMVDWGRSRTNAIGRRIGSRRALLMIGFGGIALAGAACSDGGGPPPTQSSCAPSTGRVTIPAAGTQLSNGTAVGNGTAATTLAVGSSHCASVIGEEVAFTATLTWPAGATTPTSPPGYISIGTSDGQNQTAFDGCDKLALAPADGSTTATVTCPHTFTSISSQTVVAASYNGDTTFAPSGGGYVQTVNGAPTTTTLSSSSPNPSVSGQEVTFTAAVSASALGTPTGTVVFSDNGSPITCTGGTQTLSNGGATCTTAALTAGVHAVTATYQGDLSHAASTTATGLSQTVNKATTTTAVSTSVNPSVVGQSVTFTATVAASSPGSGTPTGDVQFSLNGTNLGSPAALSAGTATSPSASSLAVGPSSITASYQGDTNFVGSTPVSALTQTVTKAPTSTSVSASPITSVFGQPVTFTATVTFNAPGAGAPTGTVSFADNGTPIGCTGGMPTLDNGGGATCTTSALPVGDAQVVATYQGDASFAASPSSPLSQPVSKAATTTALSPSSVNPTVAGQDVTFTASVSVTAPGAGVPTGAVAFFDEGAPLGTAQLASQAGSGQATLTTSGVSVGARSVTATYQADDDFDTSTSSPVTQQVNKASTSTALASSANPSVFGQPVTITARVSASPPGSGTPTGSVQFVVDGTDSGIPVALSAGNATTPPLRSLSVGTHTITATYQGDGSFLVSTTGTGLSQAVQAAATTTTVSSSSNPSVFGQPLSFTATVASIAPGAGAPGGTVTFVIDGAAQPAVGLSGGRATLPSSALAIGTHTVTATYASSDGNFAGSPGTLDGRQVVNRASSTTALASSANPSTFGRAVTFTAAVTAKAPGVGTPTGAVDFSDNGRPLGAGVIGQGGRATVTTASLIGGGHTISATYRGDTHLLASAVSLGQSVGCTVITGTHNGAVTVTQATCLQGATLNAGVTVSAGGSLLIDHSRVTGPIVSDRAAAVRICASSTDGIVSLTRTSGFVLLGDGADNDDVGVAPCGGNAIRGVVNVASTSGSVELGGNTVTGTISLSGSTGSAAEVEGNRLTGALFCTGNSPAPNDGGETNLAVARLGQCGSPDF
jgi:large repetitive protein